MSVGKRLSELAGATTWLIGDWLAYGQTHYLDSKWGKRVPDGLYEQVASETGMAIQTLTNAKYVCTALPLSLRREKLTFAHALEVVSRAPKGQYEFWVGKTVDEDLTVKALRERLRKATATHKEEPNDTGTKSFLETTRQFVRDYQSAADGSFTAAFRKELLKILDPVLKDLTGRG